MHLFRAEHKAATQIQRIRRGVLGRKLAAAQKWKRIAVVPNEYALKLLLLRSHTVRVEKGWQEMFDPTTGSFWYYDNLDGRNVWQAPLCFQKSFVCYWQGSDYPYVSALDGPCR
jgi:hypothetical protein